MKPKVLIAIILLAFVAAAVAYLVVEETRTTGDQTRNQVSGQATLEKANQAGGQGAAGDTAANPAGAASESDKAAPTSREAAEGVLAKSARADKATAPAAAATPGTDAAARPGDIPSPASTSNPRVIAYYFHGTQRCATCRKLEAYSHEAITLGFAAQLRNGSLEWRVVNTDEPANKHFVDDYKLYTRSLVIVRMQQGRQANWKNLERIWDLVDDKAGFLEYVQQEINAYMGTS